MLHKITQISPKVVQLFRKSYYKTLGTSVIKQPNVLFPSDNFIDYYYNFRIVTVTTLFKMIPRFVNLFPVWIPYFEF